jgi:hypothetical protein
MINPYAAILTVIIMTLINASSVLAQSQNETNETGIGENQNTSGRIAALSEGFEFAR